MTVARSQIVDVSVTPWYHVISKTVRGARRLYDGELDRKQWIEERRDREATARPGLLDGFSLGSYLQLVDWTSRIVRKGKTRIS